jgi:hypothetical protein
MKWTHAENAVFVAMQGMVVEEEQVIGLIAHLDELLKTNAGVARSTVVSHYGVQASGCLSVAGADKLTRGGTP